MKKTIQTILLGFQLISFSCSVSDPLDSESVSINTDQAITLKTVQVSNLKDQGIYQVSGIIKQGDQLIIGDRIGLRHAVNIDLRSQAQKNLFPRGRSHNAAVAVTSLSTNSDSEITAFDFRQGKLLITPTANTPQPRSTASSFIQLPTEQQHISAIKAGPFVIATGIYEEGRYLLYSPEENKAAYFLTYPDHPSYPNIQEKTKGVLYASTVLKARPDNQAFVCADMYSGIIAICRIESNQIERIQQHCFHYPKVNIKEGSRFPDVAYSQNNYFGFSDIAVSQDRIYAIYSGKTYKESGKNFQHCQTLLVFDWDGNLLSNFKLEEPVTHITYDTKEKKIYVSNTSLFQLKNL